MPRLTQTSGRISRDYRGVGFPVQNEMTDIFGQDKYYCRSDPNMKIIHPIFRLHKRAITTFFAFELRIQFLKITIGFFALQM